MGKAVDCKRCKTDRHLKFKCMDETAPDNVWWITCEGCGSHSEPKPTMSQAGEQWNKENSNAGQVA